MTDRNNKIGILLKRPITVVNDSNYDFVPMSENLTKEKPTVGRFKLN